MTGRRPGGNNGRVETGAGAGGVDPYLDGLLYEIDALTGEGGSQVPGEQTVGNVVHNLGAVARHEDTPEV